MIGEGKDGTWASALSDLQRNIKIGAFTLDVVSIEFFGVFPLEYGAFAARRTMVQTFPLLGDKGTPFLAR